jgi:tRNA modification GTPase
MSSIAALATAPGYAALSIIRASGELSGKVFPNLEPRRASLRPYVNIDGSLIDEVVVVFYEGKASYTGEDSLEITCHGNPLVVKKIVDDLLARGFEMAGPGEFTRRAFTNGKLDLTQAEAVQELIAARSERALEAANRVLAGELGARIHDFSDRLMSVIAQVEAYIDFPEEGLPPEGPLNEKLTTLMAELKKLCATADAHRLTHSGARVAIVGETNAGKSSLFNALLGHDRAIVSQQKGTTRDYLEADMVIEGQIFVLVDTAGLNENPDAIESLGIERTRDQLATADIVLWVVDGTAALPARPAEMDEARTLIALNKSDLAGFKIPPTLRPTPIAVSATTGGGLAELKAALLAALADRLPAADTLTVSARHADALAQASEQLHQAQELIKSSASAELIAHHLRQALNHLGEIVGRFDNEQILDKLFSTFCIGK